MLLVVTNDLWWFVCVKEMDLVAEERDIERLMANEEDAEILEHRNDMVATKYTVITAKEIRRREKYRILQQLGHSIISCSRTS